MDETPEGLHLEYKRKADPSPPVLSKDERKAIAEAVSAFANSDGGILVLGVRSETRNHADIAVEIVPIAGIDQLHGEIRKIVELNVSPQVRGVSGREPDIDRVECDPWRRERDRQDREFRADQNRSGDQCAGRVVRHPPQYAAGRGRCVAPGRFRGLGRQAMASVIREGLTSLAKSQADFPRPSTCSNLSLPVGPSRRVRRRNLLS